VSAGAAHPGTPGDLELASAGDVDQLVRARGTLFLVTDRNGDISPAGARELGLFYHDTRYLSHYALHVSGGQVVRLSDETSGDAFNQVDLMLSGLEKGGTLDDPQHFLHIRRRQMLDGGLVEQIALTSFLHRRVTIGLSLSFAADFADIFEVRGARRKRRGVVHPPQVEGRTVRLRYTGLCGADYVTTVRLGVPPIDLSPGGCMYEVEIAPGEDTFLEISVTPENTRGDRPRAHGGAFRQRTRRLAGEAESFRERSTKISCDDGRLQRVLDRSLRDLSALRLEMPEGAILAAGIPWFCAPFGRDALIASYEALLVNPELALDALRVLAARQGTKTDPRTEEEPGKIFHELRFGEMAKSGEIPHSPYYGSIDATPLFVVVLDALFELTAERAVVEEMAGALRAALAWIDMRSDEGTRFVTYARSTPLGLENQGWKDSRAGVSYPDGRRAEPPIALVEVQGYCADAYLRGARLLDVLGDPDLAAIYRERAARLRALVEDAMWLEEPRRYAFALDGHRRPLHTVVSNVGHLLWSRIPSEERAAATARLLLGHASHSGFGVRTLAAGQPVYNPLSYHNGTVWPHDNALVARGLSSYGLGGEALAVFDGLYAAMSFFADARVPELFCGISRRHGPLVRYPVACSPQAWSAAAPFLLIQSILGIWVDAPRGRLTIKSPLLPPYVRRLDVRGMRIGSSVVSMRFRRVGARCHVDRLDVSGAPLRTQIELE
jgi:glycogen debranching enzyme